MDSDPRLVVFFIILSTNPKMLQMMNILVKDGGHPQKMGSRESPQAADEQHQT